MLHFHQNLQMAVSLRPDRLSSPHELLHFCHIVHEANESGPLRSFLHSLYWSQYQKSCILSPPFAWSEKEEKAPVLPYRAKMIALQELGVWQGICIPVHFCYGTIHREQNKLLPIHCRSSFVCHSSFCKSAATLNQGFAPQQF